MNLNSMTFTAAEGGDVFPETVTVTMTIAEAALVARIALIAKTSHGGRRPISGSQS